MSIENEYEGKVVLVTGGAKLFFQTFKKSDKKLSNKMMREV